MKRLLDITICLAEQGLAFRSHREDTTDESSHSSNQGNFLALVKLLAKYDETLVHHLTDMKRKKSLSSRKKKEGKQRRTKGSGRGNLVTFLSAESQNKLINSIANKILHVILDEIKTVHYNRIAMDSPTDRAKRDQLSCIIRYIDKSYYVVEKLICVNHIKDTSAKGLFKALTEILNKNGISLINAVGQSYDGASVMRGKYNGVKKLVQDVSPQCIYIWTLDHVLNPVIMDACGASLSAKSLFGSLEKLYAFFAKKNTREVTFLKSCKKTNASYESIAQKGFQPQDGGRIKKHLIMCFCKLGGFF